MNSSEDRPINLSVHESSDPEMLERDAQSKTSEHHTDSEREDESPHSDVELKPEDRLAERQITTANLSAG